MGYPMYIMKVNMCYQTTFVPDSTLTSFKKSNTKIIRVKYLLYTRNPETITNEHSDFSI